MRRRPRCCRTERSSIQQCIAGLYRRVESEFRRRRNVPISNPPRSDKSNRAMGKPRGKAISISTPSPNESPKLIASDHLISSFARSNGKPTNVLSQPSLRLKSLLHRNRQGVELDDHGSLGSEANWERLVRANPRHWSSAERGAHRSSKTKRVAIDRPPV